MYVSLRPATLDDAAAIQAIYAHHVKTGTGTFEIEPPSLSEMTARMVKIAARGSPWLVACDGTGHVLGYAYAGPFRERPAYDCTVEDSVYVAQNAMGHGIGRALLSELIQQCTAKGYSQMLAVIGDSDNHASISLHRAMGFAHVGVLRHVGQKFGRELDVVILQKSL
ncbi:L-methionine sulfoximine/L-methionine sulfone acetyltransferase [Candidatus Phycosocius bacilliformis]|uniref:L-methionine sulfoximine/L-methionine sulfone acetyltransferase n=1 Tax=Candidatus Phycosocius bacilliformis TaxID=1445552 RepID=A0A2P2EDV8_9PROT|nr:GNAT family N-acetyltransferase [Candidatus Phycosocius bacilliformis]GBF59240.1 L-methionine sulfoximine/L-methionine sulfone acetyltransferase [Candidatus Phycosocius bacilliformis]